MRASHFLPGLLLFLFSCNTLLASDSKKEYVIQWLPVYEKKLSVENTFRSLNFEGASFDEKYNPRYVFNYPLTSYASKVNVSLKNVVTAPLPEAAYINNIETIGNSFLVESKVVMQKKKPLAAISVLPIRRTASGTFEKLISFEVDINPVYSARQAATRTYASSSVLATGDWFRLAVLQNGIYKIDYNMLKNMGVDVDQVDPNAIQLFGNGGGMLPFANDQFRYDDLQQNAIFVSGAADGTFDTQDYILFYGINQTRWNYDASSRQFNHQINLYADTTYYFLTVGNPVSSKRISQRASAAGATQTVTSFDDHIYHQADIYNFLKSGREWLGEGMDNLNNSLTITAQAPNIISSDTLFFRSVFAGRSTSSNSNSINFTMNGVSQGAVNFTMVGTNSLDPYYIPVSLNKNFFPNSQTLSVKFTLSSLDLNVQCWLNYFEMNFRRELNASGTGGQLLFRDKNTIGSGNISEFRIANTNPNYVVWDVTDRLNVVRQEATYASNTTSFSVATDELRQFIAYDGSNYYTPIIAGRTDNQNLHALAQATMLIITNPLFLQQAYDLADFHRTFDSYSVVVATTQQIFNEFSSGAQDVSAIRDFVKMFYDRATTVSDLPKYVLLFGDASYDNKYRIPSNTNYVTSYQSAGSLNLTQTYMSDDFFGLLDDNEGEWTTSEIVDLAVGRIPVKSATEAAAAVNKIRHYANGNGQLPNASFGNWRNVVTFVADDQDNNTHFKQSDSLAKRVANSYPIYNLDKIYLDAYNQESTPGGQRYPDVQSAINNRVERGSLLLTYIGHGGELGWAHERVLEVNDINSWTNIDRLSAFLTATCEFTRVDDPGRTSAGEMVYLNPTGGAICLFTTSRLAFSSSNYALCQKFFTHVFTNTPGQEPTCGEVFEKTKVDYFYDPFVRNFLLIGDPALKLAYPKFSVRTKSLNGVDVSQPIDTLKALSKVTITGEVVDLAGNKLSNFNGTIFPTVFDKVITYSTLGNDQFEADISTPQPFQLQKNVIYSGKASVTNGDFSFTFVVPKDIAFNYGKGKLSYYAHNGQTDAAGYDTSIVVGGVSTNLNGDVHGPIVDLYINDEKFVRGGLTDKDPILYAVIRDSSGINTVGTGIGHDMTAELDGKSDKKYVLNDYYENDLDSYQSGKVRYPFKDLAAGPHTLTLKIWDVFNNSSIASTDFVVAETAELALDHVLNYPNPFTTNTTFMFEHNRPFVNMDVQVQIYTVSGKLIKTLSDNVTPTGYRIDNLKWNGLDDYGDRIGRGVYLYKLRVRTDDGQYADKFEKLVILR